LTISWEVFAAIVTWLTTVAIIVFRVGRMTQEFTAITQEVERLRNDLRGDLERLRADLRQVADRYNDRLGELERTSAVVKDALRRAEK
jgi:methyl-accepting chemotaxis protein